MDKTKLICYNSYNKHYQKMEGVCAMKKITGKYWAANGKIRLQLSFNSALRGEVALLLKEWRRVGTGVNPEKKETIFIFENNLENAVQFIERKTIQNKKLIINLEEAK